MTVGVFGAKGKLGSLILKTLQSERFSTFELDTDLSHLNSRQTAVLIDVTSDKGSGELAKSLLELGDQCSQKVSMLVVGSTGHSLETAQRLQSLSALIPVCIVSNFSLGLTFFEQMLMAKTKGGMSVKDLALKFGFDFALTEIHHSQKLDAPSGTALTLAKTIGLPKESVSSARVGKVVGEHTLILSRDSEEIRIQHIAHERKLFAEGAVALVKAIIEAKKTTQLAPGFYEKEFFLLPSV